MVGVACGALAVGWWGVRWAKACSWARSDWQERDGAVQTVHEWEYGLCMCTCCVGCGVWCCGAVLWCVLPAWGDVWLGVWWVVPLRQRKSSWQGRVRVVQHVHL